MSEEQTEYERPELPVDPEDPEDPEDEEIPEGVPDDWLEQKPFDPAGR